MIIVKLSGGLGNQLFQYALGRHLAIVNNTLLKLDVTAFATYKLHKYSLGAFNIKEHVADKDEILSLTTRKKEPFDWFLQLFHKKKLPARTYVKEKTFYEFEPEILRIGDNAYLDGYWQSEKYFTDIAEMLRQECSVKNPQTGKDAQIAARIKNCDSVSLHIRRGDYVADPKTQESFGVFGLEYYLKAVQEIKKRVGRPTFFVFTDDPQWGKENLSLDAETVFVDHNNADKNYEDLRLMSQCRHHIIANSSFSWWGAWLNADPNKIVFAPMRWVNNRRCRDIIPQEWNRL